MLEFEIPESIKDIFIGILVVSLVVIVAVIVGVGGAFVSRGGDVGKHPVAVTEGRP